MNALTPYKTRLVSLGLGLSLLSATLHSAHATQYCYPNTAITRPDSQYQISSDGAEVLDTRTGLTWKRCLMGATWNGSACAGVAGGFSWIQAMINLSVEDWRLPDIKELQSLVESTCYNPAINTVVFPGDVALFDWSSSAAPFSFGFKHTFSQIVNFLDGRTSMSNNVTASNGGVRLVRRQ